MFKLPETTEIPPLIIRTDIPIAPDPLPMVRDEKIYEEAERTGKWALLEELEFGMEGQLSAAAERRRCIRYLLETRRAHDALDAEWQFKELDRYRYRQLASLNERLKYLVSVGLITDTEKDLFDAYQKGKDDDRESLRVRHMLEILLWDYKKLGENPRKEAERYARLITKSSAESFKNRSDILARSRGLTQGELREFEKKLKTSTYYEARIVGFPPEFAQAWADGYDRKRPMEEVEADWYLLRVIRTKLNEMTWEQQLAVRDFGFQNLYDYLRLETKVLRAKSLHDTNDILQSHLVRNQYLEKKFNSLEEAQAEVQRRKQENARQARGLLLRFLDEKDDCQRFAQLHQFVIHEPFLRPILHPQIELMLL